MSKWDPTFLSCTWGAGGSSQERTMAVCATAQVVHGVETLLHLTCTNMEKQSIDEALLVSLQVGVAAAAAATHLICRKPKKPASRTSWPCVAMPLVAMNTGHLPTMASLMPLIWCGTFDNNTGTTFVLAWRAIRKATWMLNRNKTICCT